MLNVFLLAQLDWKIIPYLARAHFIHSFFQVDCLFNIRFSLFRCHLFKECITLCGINPRRKSTVSVRGKNGVAGNFDLIFFIQPPPLIN